MDQSLDFTKALAEREIDVVLNTYSKSLKSIGREDFKPTFQAYQIHPHRLGSSHTVYHSTDEEGEAFCVVAKEHTCEHHPKWN